MAACQNFAHVSGNWFQGVKETGWALRKDPTKMEYDIFLIFNNFKNDLIEDPTWSKALEDPVLARSIVDYFRDKELAAKTMVWLKECASIGFVK